MAIAVLIILAVIFYSSALATIANYFVKMKREKEAHKKLLLTDKSTCAVIVEQIVAFLAVIIFYAIKMNDIEIAVDNAVAIPLAVLFVMGIVITTLVDRIYMRKHFPDYAKKRADTEQDQKMNILRRDTLAVGLAVSMINFLFNLMLFGAIACLK